MKLIAHLHPALSFKNERRCATSVPHIFMELCLIKNRDNLVLRYDHHNSGDVTPLLAQDTKILIWWRHM